VLSHLHTDKKILNRVKRLQGQIGAVEQAIQDPERGCIEVLQQVAAIKGAVNGLMNELIESHLRHHVIGDQCEVNEHELEEFMKLLKRYS
jgi:DNA-binding FrmR family transcriptional regulator